MKKLVQKIWNYLSEDIWDIEPENLPALRRWGVKSARIVQMIFRGFKDDECPLHASALTFSTLMAIVPVLALSIAIARGFGDTNIAREKVKGVVQEFTSRMRGSVQASNINHNVEVLFGSPGTNTADAVMTGSDLAEEIEALVDKGFDSAESISFTAIGGLGLVVLVWMVVDVLSRVEASFNKVWGVMRGRPLLRKFTDYLSAVFVLPFLVLLASSLPVVDFATRFVDADTALTIKAMVGSPLLKNAAVVILTSLAFTFLIMFMPNTRVRLGAGLAGGFAAGFLFVMWLSLCAALQLGAARSGKIYGSFAVVPILLAWVFVSWEIVLLGAESAFALQNYGTYRREQRARRASFNSRMILALCVVTEAARKMLQGGGCLDLSEYAASRGIPVRFLNDVVSELARQGYLGELADRKSCYTLLRSPSDVRVQEVADAFVYFGEDPARLGMSKSDEKFRLYHELADKAVKRTVGGLVFADVAGRPGLEKKA